MINFECYLYIKFEKRPLHMDIFLLQLPVFKQYSKCRNQYLTV